jgi:hypothetical protein
MPVAFTATAPEHLPALASLMRQAFDAPADAPFLRAEVLHWKYLEPCHPPGGNPLPRAWLIAQNELPVAHGCLWPVTIPIAGQPVAGACLIDWFSAKSSSGMGVMLVRKVLDKVPFLISIGGSAATRQIMPKIGFRTLGQLPVYARPLRSWAQLRARPDGITRKNILRAVRNFTWSQRPPAPSSDWSATPGTPSASLLDSTRTDGASVTSSAFLSYILRCPLGQLTTWILLRNGAPQGWFLLSRLRGQTRLLDLRLLPSSNDTAYAAAYAAAIDAALDDPAAQELTVQGSLSSQPTQALIANGFVLREQRPLFLCDPQDILASVASQLHLSRLDDDSAAFDFPEYPFLT